MSGPKAVLGAQVRKKFGRPQKKMTTATSWSSTSYFDDGREVKKVRKLLWNLSVSGEQQVSGRCQSEMDIPRVLPNLVSNVIYSE